MDFTQIRNTAESQYDAGTKCFDFQAKPFGSADIAALCAGQLGIDNWVVTGADDPVVDPQRQTVTISGTTASLAGFSNVGVEMTLFLSGGTAQLFLTLALGSGWKFITAFPMLKNTVFENVGPLSGTQPYYCYASQPYVDPARASHAFASGLNFYGQIQPAGGPFDYLGQIIGTFANGTLAGPLHIGKNGPTMNLALDLGLIKTLEDKFPILKNQLALAMLSSFDDDGWSGSGLEISTHFDFGNNRGLKVAAILDPWLFDQILFTGTFENMLLPSFQQFAGEFTALIGANDLHSSLPDGYGDDSHLALNSITLGLDVNTFTPSSASLQIGTPANDPGWDLSGVATVKQVQFYAAVGNPFATDGSRVIDVSVMGEVDIPTSGSSIDMVASAGATFRQNQPGTYRLQAGLAPGTDLAVPLGDLLGTYVPAAKDAPTIYLAQLGFDFSFGQTNHYGFVALLDEAKPATFTFGGSEKLVIKSGGFSIANDANQGKPGGEIQGAIELFGIATDFDYVMPGEFKVTAHFPAFDIDCNALIKGLADPAWQSPGWMPVIPFPKTDLYLGHSSLTSTDTLALRAEPAFGTIVLQAVHANSAWGFGAGLSLNVQKIASFAGLNMLSRMDDMFACTGLIFVFSSIDLPSGFQFPPATDFPASTSAKTVALPKWAGPIKAGFYFYGGMAFNFQASPNLKLVEDMFSLQKAAFELFVFIGLNPEQSARALARMSGQVKIGANSFAEIDGSIGAAMEAGIPKLFVEGAITVDVNDNAPGGTRLSSVDPALSLEDKITGAIAFELNENAAYLMASMIGQITFGRITLAQLVLVIGIDFEGIPSLGLAASIDLTLYHTTYDSSIAFFFDSGNPQNSLFAGSVSDINLGQVLTTLVGAISGGDTPPKWLTDLLGEIALEGTQRFPMAASARDLLNKRDYVALSAAFNAAMQQAKIPGQVNFNQDTTMIVIGGIEDDRHGQWFITDYPASDVIRHYELTLKDNVIEVAMEAQVYYCLPPGGGSITLGPPSHGLKFNSGVNVSGKLKIFMLELEVLIDIRPNRGLIADVKLDKPLEILRIPGTQTHLLSLKSATDPQLGPEFSMATFTEGAVTPHVKLDGAIDFLGIASERTVIDISDKGLHLDFEARTGDASLGSLVKVKADFDNVTDFAFDFSADVHINHPDFKLFNLDLGTIDLNADVACALSFGAKDGELFLTIDGAHFDIDGQRFGLPKVSLSVSTDKLSDLPGIIFAMVKQAIWDFVADVGNWLEWVAKGIIKGVADIEAVLEDVFHAIGAVWSADQRIIVAINENYSASQAFTVEINPAQPTPGVTQEMIDQATAWSHAALQDIVARAAIDHVEQLSPDDVADFKVSSLDNVDRKFDLQENLVWVMHPAGAMPSLTQLGYLDPMDDQRFFRRSTKARQFKLHLAIDGDFARNLAQVTAKVRYAGEEIGGTYLYTSNAPQTFNAPWDETAGTNFEVCYTATYLDQTKPPVTSPWMRQRGTEVSLIVMQGGAQTRRLPLHEPA